MQNTVKYLWIDLPEFDKYKNLSKQKKKMKPKYFCLYPV